MNLFVIILSYILFAFCIICEIYISCVRHKRRKEGISETRTQDRPYILAFLAIVIYLVVRGSYVFFIKHSSTISGFAAGLLVLQILLLIFVCYDSRSIAIVGDKFVVTKYFFYIKKYPKEEVRFSVGAYYYKKKCLFRIGRYDETT